MREPDTADAGRSLPFCFGVLVGLLFATALFVAASFSADRLTPIAHVWVTLSSGAAARCTVYPRDDQ